MQTKGLRISRTGGSYAAIQGGDQPGLGPSDRIGRPSAEGAVRSL